ncbi:MAG: hypothetical protein SH856_12385 [Flavobacteriales bacterium]|nr:hypothetical protein [Flavobacteriales bacterium]
MDRTILIFVVFMVFTCAAIAQVDSLRMDSVIHHDMPTTVVEIGVIYFPDVSTDSILFQQYVTGNVGKILEHSGQVQLNSYGAPGLAAQVRINGAGADHSVFYWQGIPLNSFSLGSMDASLLPAFFFDDVRRSVGALSFFETENALAGNFHLQNFRLNDRRKISLHSEYNSLMNLWTGASVDLAGKNAGSNTKVFFNHLENNFTYRDKYAWGNPVVKQEHNSGFQQGAMHESWWNPSESTTLSVAAWHQNREMELPDIMGSAQAGTAQQRDEFTRVVARWSRTGFSRLSPSWEVSTAYFDEWQRYRDLPSGDDWGIVSKIKSQHALARGVFHFNKENWRWSASAQSGAVVLNTDNYASQQTTENYLQLAARAMFHVEKHQWVADLTHDARKFSTRPSATLSYLWGNRRAMLTLSASRKYRIADFNERYWSPGGNGNLHPEQGMNYNAQFRFNEKFSQKLSATIIVEMFHLDISDWIQWVPTDAGFWQPENLKRVRSSGAESRIVLNLSGQIKKSLRLSYTYTNALGSNNENWSETFAMIYTPHHKAIADASVESGKFMFTARSTFASARYSDETNTASRILDAYGLFDFHAHYTIVLKSMSLQFRTSVENIFDTFYESVRAYALPGRIVSFGIKSDINFTTKNHSAK